MTRCPRFSGLILSLLWCFQSTATAQLVNVAIDKPTSASTILNGTFLPSRAVDGSTDENVFYHSSTNDFAPSWQVDLEENYTIEEVHLYNRADGSGTFGNRLNNVFVEVLDEFDNQVFLSSIFNPWDGEGTPANPDPGTGNNGPHVFDIGSVVGRTVRVFKDPAIDGSEWLPLAEVEVYVDPASLTSLSVDRTTGAITLNHAAGAPSNLSFIGYSITSDIGALDPSGWKSIAENYDADSGDMSFDSNDTWTELTSPSSLTDLSEFQFSGTANDGGTLTPGSSLVLSEGNIGAGSAWIATNNENDLRMQLTLPDGSNVDVPVVYTGNGDLPLSRSDFDANGVIDGTDYLTLLASLPSDTLSGASAALQHQQGDTDFDGDVDIDDFENFRADYEAISGPGSFAQLVGSANVPEPATVWIASLAAGALLVRRRNLGRWVAGICLVFGIAMGTSAHADTLGWWRMGDDDASPTNDGLVSTVNINSGTYGNMTSQTEQPFYSNTVPGGTIKDPLTNTNYMNEWSIRSALDGIAPQSVGTASQAVPTGAFTYETFVQFQDTSVSAGEDFGRQWNPDGEGGFLMELAQAGSTSAVFETVSVSIRTRDGVPGDVGTGFNLTMNSTTRLVDNQWYHVALVFDGNSQDESNDIHLYIDGELEASANVNDTSSFVPASGAPILAGEVVSDGSIRVDEVRYLDQALAPSDFLRVGTLKTTINTTTGEIRLINDTLQNIDLSSYQIDSPMELLSTAGWNSLSNQNVDPVGTGTGETWDEGQESDASSLSEVFWLSSSELLPGESLTLGNAYGSGSADDGLTVRYHDRALGTTLDAFVEYITSTGALPGDFNGDGNVDAADYTVWRNNLGASETVLGGAGDNSGTVDIGDYTTWKSNFGASSGSGSLLGTTNNVPEPTSIAMLVLVLGLSLAARRSL